MSMSSLMPSRVLAVGTVFLVVLCYIYLQRPEDNSVLSKETRSTKESESPASYWMEADLTTVNLPKDIEERKKKVEIEQRTVNIKGVETFVQSASPPPGVHVHGQNVVLLHGAAFTSQTWISQVPTIATLASVGYRVEAIDLPGYGRSKGAAKDKGDWLSEAITVISPDNLPVVVSPSMSGSFIIPLLEKHPEKIAGWIPVAPVNTAQGRSFFPSLRVPTLIVYGELDTGLGVRSAADLALIPTATKPQELPGAKHPAYLDQPDLWHKLVVNFLKLL